MSKLFEQLLAVRDLGGDFLRPRYETCVQTVGLPDIEKAVQRIKQAVQKQERVLIYGDYDVDGVTASAVLHDTLRLAGIKDIIIMLPNRFTDGYGMSKKAVQRAVDEKVQLVMTVDCGSRNHEVIDDLNAAGVETIITDHHECANDLPKALAVVNPKRKDVKVPADLRELAGVGVAFKLAQALVAAGLIPNGQEKWLLDLVALGTVCDSMRLVGENRRLCHYGLKVLEKTRRVGLKELMRLAGVKNLNSEAIGFQIGPRINAAGRMDTAERALELLMTDNRVQAAHMADGLENLNRERKTQQNAAVEEINKRGVGEAPVIVEKGDWHEGILGIIAGKLTEEYRRPAFVLAEVDGTLKGSGRSFGDFNLADALNMCQKYIIGGGGHAEACGVRLERDNFENFRNAVNQYYRDLNLKEQERFLAVHEDLAVTDFADFSLELLEEMKALEPYGMGNDEPIFLLPNVRVVEASRLGTGGKHLRLIVWDQNGRNMKLMKFYAPEEYFCLRGGEIINAWIRLEENEFRGLRSIEGRIVQLTF